MQNFKKWILLFYMFIAFFLFCESFDDNEFYKKVYEYFNLAKQEIEKGDYDKAYEYSEQSKLYLDKANEYNNLKIIILKVNTKKELAKKEINEALNNGANTMENVLEFYNNSLKYFENADKILSSINSEIDNTQKLKLYKDALDDFTNSEDNAKQCNITIQELTKNIFNMIVDSKSKRDKLISDKIITINDVNYNKINTLITKCENLYNKQNIIDSKKTLDEINAFFENIYSSFSKNEKTIKDDEFYKNESLKIYEIAKNEINNLKIKDIDKLYANAINESENFLLISINLYNEKKYIDSIKNSENAINILNKLIFKEDNEALLIFPRYYKIQLNQKEPDYLWKIAKYTFIYNDSLKWEILYNANKERLFKKNNPDLIYPLKIIEIPSINGEKREGIYNPNKKYPLFDLKVKY